MDNLIQSLTEKFDEVFNEDGSISESVIKFAIETAIIEALEYMNISVEEWPSTINQTVILLAQDIIVDAINSLTAQKTGEDAKEVSELKEGDFNISFNSPNEVKRAIRATRSSIRKYSKTFNRYRRMRW